MCVSSLHILATHGDTLIGDRQLYNITHSLPEVDRYITVLYILLSLTQHFKYKISNLCHCTRHLMAYDEYHHWVEKRIQEKHSTHIYKHLIVLWWWRGSLSYFCRLGAIELYMEKHLKIYCIISTVVKDIAREESITGNIPCCMPV